METITTDRLNFRQWRESDIDNITSFFSDVDACKHVGGVKSKEESWRLIASYIGHYQLKGYSYMAVETNQDKSLIGSVGLWNSTPWPELELGYWILPKFQGYGYAVEAAAATKNWAFNNLKIETLVSYITKDNVPSIRLSQRIGGEHDGSISLLEYGPHDIYRYSE